MFYGPCTSVLFTNRAYFFHVQSVFQSFYEFICFFNVMERFFFNDLRDAEETEEAGGSNANVMMEILS